MKSLDKRIEKLLDKIIRVDYAGELGAKNIYSSQIKVEKNEEKKQKLQQMLSQELEHLEYFTKIGKEQQIRPSFFHNVFNFTSKTLGILTAKMGFKSAMACTAGVEEVICQHYNEQLEEINEILHSLPEDNKYYNILSELHTKIAQFLEDEKGHQNEGLNHSSNEFTSKASYNVSKFITRTAIKIASVL